MRWMAAAIVLAGCYQPAAETQCRVSCLDGVCPSGLACGDDHKCHGIGELDCSLQPQSDSGVDAHGDADIDAPPIDAPANFPCYGSADLRVCFPMPPSGEIDFLNTAVIDTTPPSADCTMMMTTSGRPVCVVAAATIKVAAGVHATGTLPYVLIATTYLEVSGTLSVASDTTPLLAIGAGAGTCASGAGDANNGGGGGSYATLGGSGGDGGQLTTTVGAATPHPNPTGIAGGCAGGAGGGGTAGGPGGGTLYLISPMTVNVTMTGVLDASGAGGLGGVAARHGGGGGGAGGFIGISALSPTLDGGMYAAGGGGGAGANDTLNGTTPRPTTCISPGGSAPAGAGSGGTGANGATLGGAGGSTSGFGAGGGGGGAGRIVVHGGGATNGVACPTPTFLSL